MIAMRAFRCRLRPLLGCAISLISSLVAQAQTAGPLPRVLILGDVIYQEPVASLAKEFKGRAEVVRGDLKSGEGLSTTTALAGLDTLLGTGKWDLIHFNFGLGDLIHRAPGMKSFRVMPIDSGGVRTTDPKLYESNLRELVKRLKATGAKLVWASTTPIRASATNVFRLGSEIEYNEIAAKVMTEAQIPINDMYSHARSLMNMDKPGSHGVDPFYFDGKPIHEPIAKIIQSHLALP
ncbi:MAG: hypothetical protein CFE26_11065 [Verrucomicrobiales bacterium VVV1]|nr:MAG: hypothetical protein CFE26_11065 [Verrucomicrobiales bacterium VVV1]